MPMPENFCRSCSEFCQRQMEVRDNVCSMCASELSEKAREHPGVYEVPEQWEDEVE